MTAFDELVVLARGLAEDVRDLDEAYVSEIGSGRDLVESMRRVEQEYRDTLRKINALVSRYSEE